MLSLLVIFLCCYVNISLYNGKLELFVSVALLLAGTVYINIVYYKSGIWLVISPVASYFHKPEASANTA